MSDTTAELPTFTLTNKGGITGYANAIKLKHDKTEVKTLAGILKSIGHFDGLVPNQERTLKKKKTVRLDRETNTSDNAANLQIQVNDKNAKHTTIGQVLVSQAAYKAANEHKEKKEASDKLLKTFEDAMLKSYGDGNSYEITTG